MGFRFKKSVKIAPGVKLNIGKKSAGISVGGKVGGISLNSSTGARARVSVPGTGMSYSTKISGSSSNSKKSKSTTAQKTSTPFSRTLHDDRDPEKTELVKAINKATYYISEPRPWGYCSCGEFVICCINPETKRKNKVSVFAPDYESAANAAEKMQY